MISPENTRVRSTRLKTYFWVLIVVWTALVIGLLSLDFLQIEQVQQEMAITEARANFNKDQAFRFWSSKHGGVYVPINSRTPENPFLSHVSERDITTESGKALTLMNPAYMLRQMLEEYEDLFGIRGHITSLKHYRPETAPDEWEKAALAAFERGDKEVLEFTEIKGAPYLRLMQPMIAKKSCLKCHARQGYKVGDVRGGVSISVPMSFYLTNQRKVFTTHAFGLGLMWLLGIAGIGMATRGLRNRIRERDRAEAELQKAHDGLEIRVDERTAELKNEIEERKQTEEALKESEQRYKKAQRMGRVGNWEYELETESFWGSDEAKHIYGFDPENKGFTTEEVESCIPERARVHQALLDLIEKNIPYNLEFEIQPLNGPDKKIIRSIAEVTKDDSGAPLKVVGLIQDITEQKKAEKAMINLERQLRQSQKIESIGTLAGGIAHDFNNILGIILGNAELAMDDLPDWNPARQNLDEVKKACMRAKDVVKQILSFSRKSEVEQKPLNLAHTVTESLKLLRASIPTNIDFRQNIANNIKDIIGDPTQIHQIMINLCTNAAHAMEKNGGNLEITLENAEIDEDTASRHPELEPGPYVHLQVSDTGYGINAEVIDRVFDPYFTTKDVGKGTGMGLAVVHGIVKSHHGSILLESKPGKGTTFKIWFPSIKEKVRDEPKDAQELPTGKERILFVDDETSMVNLNRQRLEKLGYKVIAKTDPLDALAFFSKNPDQIDLVISDMTMPHMTGDKLAQEILNIRPDMPIILCTGYSKRMSEGRAQEIGIRKYIEKPIEKETLAISVREVLDGE